MSDGTKKIIDESHEKVSDNIKKIIDEFHEKLKKCNKNPHTLRDTLLDTLKVEGLTDIQKLQIVDAYHNMPYRNDINYQAFLLRDVVKLHNLNLIGQDLSGLNLSGIDLSGSRLSTAILNNTNLRETNLTDVIFINAILSNADMRFSNLTNADLRYSNLINTELHGATTVGAQFSPFMQKLITQTNANQGMIGF